MEEVKGFIISKNIYKETSYILNLLTENKIISAKYSQSKKQNESIYDYFSYGSFIIYKGNINQYKIKSFDCELFYASIKPDFINLFFLDFLKEIINKLIPFINSSTIKKVYDLLFLALKKIIIDKCLTYNVCLYFYFKILTIFCLNLIDVYKNNLFRVYSDVFCNEEFSNVIKKDDFISLFNLFSKIIFEGLGVKIVSINNLF